MMELTRAARNANVSRPNDAGVPVCFEVRSSTTDFTKKKEKKKQVVKVAANIVMKLKIPSLAARISFSHPEAAMPLISLNLLPHAFI